MFRLRTRSLLFATACATLFAATALAQEGRITGKVVDSTGGALPGATITITSDDKGGTPVAVTSGGDGSFSASAPAGSYTVTATLLGFRPVSQKAVKVEAGGAANLDFTLVTKLATEITVTATKREENLSDVPISVAAPTEAVLRSRNIENLEAIAANTAGFSVQNLGPGQSQPAIRGISGGQIVRDQPGVKEQVGAYLDESVTSLSLFTPDLDLVDLNRVEILRGPQGTLFGSGSLAGTVRYITNQPEIGATKGFLEADGSTVSGGNQGGNVKGGFNAPLGSTAALRVAAYYDRFPGWTDAVQPDGSIKKDVNTGYRTGGRAAVRIAPNDRLSITPRIVFQKVSMDGWNREDVFNILGNPYTTTRRPVALGERQIFSQIDEPYTDKFTLGDLNVNYNWGKVSLTSVSSYTYRDILVVRDAGALTSSITGGSVGLPESLYTLDSPLNDATTAKGFTQELRLSGVGSQYHWVIGGFYSNNKKDYGQDINVKNFEEQAAALGIGIPTEGPLAPKNSLFYSKLHYNYRQFAGFGEGTWDVDNRLSLTAGLRYYDFKEDRTQFFDGIFGNDGSSNCTNAQGQAVGCPVSNPGTITATGVAPRFIVSYKAGESTRLNAQVSRGFRLGGLNDPLNEPLCTPADKVIFGGHKTWDDEKAWNYEAGSKSTLWGGKGSLNLSAFLTNITNLQTVVTAGSCSSRVIFNAPKARSQGFEAEFEVAPDSHFNLAISGSFDDSKFTETLPSATAVVATGIQDGNRLPSVPKFQAAVAATYQWTVAQGALAYVTGSYQHVGSRFTQVEDQAGNPEGNTLCGSGFNCLLNIASFGANTIGGPLTSNTFAFNSELPSYDILNARIGVRKGKWDVALFGNNLTDKLALLSLDRERGFRARVGYLTNQPRTFGVSLRVDF